MVGGWWPGSPGKPRALCGSSGAGRSPQLWEMHVQGAGKCQGGGNEALWLGSQPEAGPNLRARVLPSPGAQENQTMVCWDCSWCCWAQRYSRGVGVAPTAGKGGISQAVAVIRLGESLQPDRSLLERGVPWLQTQRGRGSASGLALPGFAVPAWPVPGVVAASLAYVRYPEPFCPVNKSKRIGRSSAVCARTESHWLQEFRKY